MRLIVFDLDRTLVHTSRTELKSLIEPIKIVFSDYTLYCYVRPWVYKTLLYFKKDKSNMVVIFSAGTSDYVYSIIDYALLPMLQKQDLGFFFDFVFTRDDLDIFGYKSLTFIEDKVGADVTFFIDDCPTYIKYCGIEFPFNIKSFNAEDKNALHDNELLKTKKLIRNLIDKI